MEEKNMKKLGETIGNENLSMNIAVRKVAGKRVRRSKLWERRKIYSTKNGVLNKEEEIEGPSFDKVGRTLEKGDKIVRCYKCRSLYHAKSTIEYEKGYLCIRCLSKEHDWDKSFYKIALCLFKGINDERTIQDLTGVEKKVVKERIEGSIGSYIIERWKFLCFRGIRLSDRGEEALALWDKVYGADIDVIALKERITGVREENREAFEAGGLPINALRRPYEIENAEWFIREKTSKSNKILNLLFHKPIYLKWRSAPLYHMLESNKDTDSWRRTSAG